MPLRPVLHASLVLLFVVVASSLFLPLCTAATSIVIVAPGDDIAQKSLNEGDTVQFSPGTYANQSLITLNKNVSFTVTGDVVIQLKAGLTGKPWLTIGSGNTLFLDGSYTFQFSAFGVLVMSQARIALSSATSLTFVGNISEAVVLMDSAQFLQDGHLNVSQAPSDISGVLIQLAQNAVWQQNGIVDLDSTTSVVSIAQNATWNQNSGVTLSLLTSVSATAVDLTGTWSSLALCKFTLKNAVGVLLHESGSWNQGGGMEMALTGAATGVSFESGTSKWSQTQSLVLTATGPEPAIGVQFNGGGTWMQQAEATITVEKEDYGLSIDAGRWTQTATAWLSASDQSFGVYMTGDAQWQQLADVTLYCSNSSRGVNLQGPSLWYQNAGTLATLSCTSDSLCANFGSGQWMQRGEVSISVNGSTGVIAEPGGVWTQNGSVTINTVRDASYGSGVHLQGSSRWNQNTMANISVLESLGVNADPYSVWEQKGPTWISTVSSVAGLGIRVHENATWTQQADTMINAVASDGNGYGAFVEGNWASSADTRTTITGTGAIIGVWLKGGTFDQGGTLNVTITGASAGTATNPAGLALVNGSTWIQRKAATISTDTGTGVIFASSAQSFWQQQAAATINIQNATIGIDMSLGTQSWTQSEPVYIYTAPGASSAKGFVCGDSGPCCTRIQAPGSLDYIIFVKGDATAGVRDDCPKVNASPSPTPLFITPLVVNTTATFSNSTPSVSVSGTTAGAGGSSSSSSRGVAVQLSLVSLLVGSTTSTPSEYNVTQKANSSSNNGTTTYVYGARLDNASSVEQTYSFFPNSSASAFAGTNFSIGAGSLKWSINLTTPDGTSASAGSQGLVLRYQLSNLLSSATNPSSARLSADEAAATLIRKSDTPQPGMTTYIVQLDAGRAVASVAVFDAAMIDDQVTPINHNLTVVLNGTTTPDNNNYDYYYMLELAFPSFNQSIFYDPSLGLGVLLTGSSKPDSGGGSDNTALIVATAVAIPVAVVVVVAVIVVALVVVWQRNKRMGRSTLDLDHALNDHGREQDDAL